jgi:hypothetical protein
MIINTVYIISICDVCYSKEREMVVVIFPRHSIQMKNYFCQLLSVLYMGLITLGRVNYIAIIIKVQSI